MRKEDPSQFADVVTGNPASLAITLTKCFEDQTWQFFQSFILNLQEHLPFASMRKILAAESPVAVSLNPETRSKSPDYDCEGMLIIWEI